MLRKEYGGNIELLLSQLETKKTKFKHLAQYNILMRETGFRVNSDRALDVLRLIETTTDLKPSAVSYNTLIHTLKCDGKYEAAVELFSQMTVQPDAITFRTTLDACCRANLLDQALQILSTLEKTPVRLETSTLNAVLQTFLNAKRPEDGLRVFDLMNKIGIKPDRTTVKCTLLLCKQGDMDTKAYDVLRSLPDAFQVTRACNVALSVCISTGNLKTALQLFERMKHPDIVTYNTLLKICSMQSNNSDLALGMYQSALDRGLTPTRRTLFSLVRTLARDSRSEEAVSILRSTENADIGLYNAVLGACYADKQLGYALGVYDIMIQRGVQPNHHAFALLIRACVQVGQMNRAFEMLTRLEQEHLEPDIDIYNALLFAYCRSSDIDGVFKIWTAIQSQGLQPDSFSYMEVISALAKSEDVGTAAELFASYQGNDVMVTNVMLNGLALSGSSKEALLLLQKTKNADLVSYNTVLKAICCDPNADFAAAERLFQQMKENQIDPELETFTLLLQASGKEENGRIVFQLVDEMISEYSIWPDAQCLAVMMRLSSTFPSRISAIYDMIIYYDVDLTSELCQTAFVVMEKNRQAELAFKLLQLIRVKASHMYTTDTCNVVLHLCRLSGNQDLLLKQYEIQRDDPRIELDVSSYSEIVQGLELAGSWDMAVKLLQEMEKSQIMPSKDLLSTSIGRYYFQRHKNHIH